MHQVIDSISTLLDDGQHKAVVVLTEYALTRLEKAIGEMDDSDGHMGDIVPALQELHHDPPCKPVKTQRRSPVVCSNGS